MPPLAILLAILLAACAAACDREPPAVPGPAYTPAAADMIRALGASCDFKTDADGNESRSCRGRQSSVRIEITSERRIRELDMTVLASTGVEEAWVLYNNVLPEVAGAAVADAAHRKLRGEPVADAPGGPRVATTIDGQRYMVKLTWGR